MGSVHTLFGGGYHWRGDALFVVVKSHLSTTVSSGWGEYHHSFIHPWAVNCGPILCPALFWALTVSGDDGQRPALALLRAIRGAGEGGDSTDV
jgi:hypothetical protein